MMAPALIAGAIIGEPVALADVPTLADVQVTMSVDGVEIARGTGADILGDPWEALVWLANHLSGRDIGLSEGQFVLSGTCTGAPLFPESSTARAHHHGLGDVTITRT